MKFTALGGGNEIGANSYLVEIEGTTLMLDAGLHPRKIGHACLPDLDILDGRPLDALLLSHCHLDHLGAVPLVLQRAPYARVLMTRPSYDLATEMLHSTVTVMERQRLEQGIKEYPFYSHEDVEMVSYCFDGIGTDLDLSVKGTATGSSDIRCRFLDAGHILGAAGIVLCGQGETVFYTGDTSRSDQELTKGAIYPDEPIDTLILECTLGASAESEGRHRSHEVRNLAGRITRVVQQGGSVLIPAFALGRTQEMLATLDRLRAQKRIPEVDIFTAGLGRVVSRIYDQNAHRSRRRDPDLRIEDLDVRPLPGGDAVRSGYLERASVIVVSSGMMEVGTLSHRLASTMLTDPRHGIFFVGYVDPGAPGHRVLSARSGERIQMGPGDDPLEVQCAVERFHFTAHAHRQDLLRLVEELSPSRVVLVHGDAEAIHWMAAAIGERHPWIEVLKPEPGLEYDLPPAGP